MAPAEAPATETVVEEQAPIEETAVLDEETETGEDEQSETTEETFSKADLEEAIKSRENEWRETREAEQHEAQRSQTEIAIRQGIPSRLTNILKWAARQVEEGKVTSEDIDRHLNRKVLEDLSDEVFSAVNFQEFDAITRHFESFVTKTLGEWKPAPEVRRRFEAAIISRNPDTRATARWEYMLAALRDTELPKALETAKKEAASKTQKATGVEKARVADGTPGPTRGTGSGNAPRSLNFRTQQEVDRALYDQKIDSRTARLWLAKGLPYS